MEIVQNSTDDKFLIWLHYLRPYSIENWEINILCDMIEKRCKKLGYNFEWGCCGNNKLEKITDKK